MIDPSSFRDPSGFVYRGEDGRLYRQVNTCYAAEYEALMDSGLYQELTSAGLLTEHEEVPRTCGKDDHAYRVTLPKEVPFISYPYEWSFSQFKDAALVSLDIQRRALQFGMTLKDCSAYNVQFEGSLPVFIDTLSFERYREGTPWVAYRQFCRHFLAPLSLMAKTDVRLGQLMRIFIDGVPLDLTARLLPRTAWLNLKLFLHIYLHQTAEKYWSNTSKPVNSVQGMSKKAMHGLIDSLRSAIEGLSWKPSGKEWSRYFDDVPHSYTPISFAEKKRILSLFIDRVRPRTAWDLGSNTGVFSQMLRDKGVMTVAVDADPSCVEINYLECRKTKERSILPLCVDLANPSPPIGWAHDERRSLIDRGPLDAAIALALTHHLCIANNVPLAKLAAFFQQLCQHLIIEFVPKEDPQVQSLLRSREDVFNDYTQAGFELAFGQHFALIERKELADSGRIMYLMSRTNHGG